VIKLLCVHDHAHVQDNTESVADTDIDADTDRGTEMDRDWDTDRERDTDRETDRDAGRAIGRNTDRDMNRDTDRDTLHLESKLSEYRIDHVWKMALSEFRPPLDIAHAGGPVYAVDPHL
jgi:hypothetical protein